MLKNLSLVLLFIPFVAQAYIPNVESLLRNGSNAEISTNSVVANLLIYEIDPVSNQKVLAKDGIIQESSIKFLFYNNDERPELIQVDYADESFNSKNLVEMKRVNFNNLAAMNAEFVEKKLFYYLLDMLVNNSGDRIMGFLKQYESALKTNEELMDAEKLDLLNKYKRYLEQVSEGNQEEEMENPLRPQDEEKRKKIIEIYKRNLIKHDQIVQRKKQEDIFSFIVNENNIYMQFNDNHELKEMRLKVLGGEIKVTLGRYILMSSELLFPEFIWITDLTGRKYEIKIKRLAMFPDEISAHRRRIERYQNAAKENNIGTTIIKPAFIL